MPGESPVGLERTMARPRYRDSTLTDALREELAGAFRFRAKSSLDAAAVSSGSIDRTAPPDSRAPFVTAARETPR